MTMAETMTTPQELSHSYVGTRTIRPDGVDKVTGRARFGADFNLAGQLIGRVLRSPHAHARIISIDISKAAALPGVKAIVTRDDFADQPFFVLGRNHHRHAPIRPRARPGSAAPSRRRKRAVPDGDEFAH